MVDRRDDVEYVNPDLAAFMADSQVPWGADPLNGEISQPAWRTRPTWYLIATEDRMIPPDAQRFMANRASATQVEAAGSHAVYVSRPEAVSAIIETAIAGGPRSATAPAWRQAQSSTLERRCAGLPAWDAPVRRRGLGRRRDHRRSR
jgi:hypothetical protein